MGTEKGLIRSLSYTLLHHHHHHRHVFSVDDSVGGGGGVRIDVPKGCMAIRVGEEEDEKERFVVPVMYLNHTLFSRLLKAAEDVYGFDQKGTISIPCSVDEFREVVGLIDEEMGFVHHHQHDHHHKNHGHGHGHHHHRPIAGCFRA